MAFRLHPSVFAAAAIHLAFLAASLPAHAQQAAAYQTRFDDVGGWYLDEYYGIPWGVDDSPIGGYSSANSLNFNDGVDYDIGSYVFGAAFSPEIDISGHASATLRFRCRYETEDLFQNPLGREGDFRFLIVMDGSGETLASLQYTDETCGAMNAWHEHETALDPSWGPVRLAFYFDTGDDFANNYQGWFIDDLVVEVPDNTAPAKVNNLAAGSPTVSSLTLTWTSPSDDDVSGVAASFDLRYSLNPITAATFAAATSLAGEPPASAAGTAHQVKVPGLSPSTTYYFALRTTDKSGNESALSNVASAMTSAAATSLPSTGGSSDSEGSDRFTACSAGMGASSGGLLILAALLGLAGIARRALK